MRDIGQKAANATNKKILFDQKLEDYGHLNAASLDRGDTIVEAHIARKVDDVEQTQYARMVRIQRIQRMRVSTMQLDSEW